MILKKNLYIKKPFYFCKKKLQCCKVLIDYTNDTKYSIKQQVQVAQELHFVCQKLGLLFIARRQEIRKAGWASSNMKGTMTISPLGVISPHNQQKSYGSEMSATCLGGLYICSMHLVFKTLRVCRKLLEGFELTYLHKIHNQMSGQGVISEVEQHFLGLKNGPNLKKNFFFLQKKRISVHCLFSTQQGNLLRGIVIWSGAA